MFERFTESARRALFFTRARAEERGGHEMNSEDLLWGVTMAAPEAVCRFAARPDVLRQPETGEGWLERQRQDAAGWVRGASLDIPFCRTARNALQDAAEEADALAHTAIRPEHLLLGLLRDENTQAWQTLHDAGVRLREVRHILASEPDCDPLPETATELKLEDDEAER